MPNDGAKKTLPEERRKEIFSALVEAQDRQMTVAQSRKEIANRFGLSESQVRRIEQEGLDNEWPPL
jgi:DNA-directed RNA polymerase specialized sigma subunit